MTANSCEIVVLELGNDRMERYTQKRGEMEGCTLVHAHGA